jgi:hypothetical protein
MWMLVGTYYLMHLGIITRAGPSIPPARTHQDWEDITRVASRSFRPFTCTIYCAVSTYVVNMFLGLLLLFEAFAPTYFNLAVSSACLVLVFMVGRCCSCDVAGVAAYVWLGLKPSIVLEHQVLFQLQIRGAGATVANRTQT